MKRESIFMELKNFIAEGTIYDVYESDGMAVRLYKSLNTKKNVYMRLLPMPVLKLHFVILQLKCLLFMMYLLLMENGL